MFFCMYRVLPNYFAKLLVRQLEHHVYDRRRIDRLAVTQSWFETDFVGGCARGLIQAVPQSADDSIHVQGAICRKADLQQNLALELQIARHAVETS